MRGWAKARILGPRLGLRRFMRAVPTRWLPTRWHGATIEHLFVLAFVPGAFDHPTAVAQTEVRRVGKIACRKLDAQVEARAILPTRQAHR